MREKISLITVGDNLDFDSFRKFHKERKKFNNSCISYYAISYNDLLRKNFPRIRTEKILFFFFFPFDYWNRFIEPRSYKGIYANISFYKKFVDFLKRVESIIVENFCNNRILFINPPYLSAIYRDKLRVKKCLCNAGILTPRLYNIKSINGINKYLSKGHSLFIKLRYGSMGKGITYVTPDICKSNFLFRKGRILSRKSDYGWRFRTILQKDLFLKKLLKGDVYIEEAIDTFLIKKRKFDLRVYVFFNKVVFIYPKSNTPESITTNISQEGQGEYPAFIRPLPKSIIETVRDAAVKVLKGLGVNFAGVDVLIDSELKKAYVIDVNLFPGFPKIKIFNLAKHLIQLLKQQTTLEYL